MIKEPGNHSAGSDNGEAALLRDLAELPKSIQPTTDPWQQISQRIASQQPRHSSPLWQSRDFTGRTWLAMAASVMLVALTGFFVMQSSRTESPVHDPVAQANDPEPGLAETSAPRPTSAVELEYQAAFMEFVRLDLSQPSVSGTAKTAMVQDWELMQQLEKDLLAALQQEPDNPLLKDRWLQLRAHQIQLLHVIAEIGQVPGRTLI